MMIGLQKTGFSLEAQRHFVVVFWNPPAPRHWIEKLFSQKPRHVVLFTYLALPAIWLQVDWALDGNTLAPLSESDCADLLIVLHNRGAQILKWTAPLKRPRQMFHAPNCVGYCQRFLGIAGLLWTPRQLMLRMMASGATPLFDVNLEEPRGSADEARGVQHPVLGN
jgi:hypothetical protein